MVKKVQELAGTTLRIKLPCVLYSEMEYTMHSYMADADEPNPMSKLKLAQVN